VDDRWLRSQVRRELELDPNVDHARVAVFAEGAAVTLTGRVASLPEKLAAVEAAERVPEVRAVADELEVDVPNAEARSGGLASATVDSTSCRPVAAERVARGFEDFRRVTNEITVERQATIGPVEVQERVREAVRRSLSADVRRVWVEARDGKVRLHGTVRSWYERKLAENAARRTPGVTDVENELEVRP
jgi:osmotically-inducible protein OsmY